MKSFVSLADRIEGEISKGNLAAGARLPAQRDLAHRESIAPSTVSRAYAELIRRGLVIGEVGRCTFVRAMAQPIEGALSAPSVSAVDLELDFPLPPGTTQKLTEGVKGLLGDSMRSAFGFCPAVGSEPLREAAAGLLRRGK